MLIAAILFVLILIIDIITEYRKWLDRKLESDAGEILTRILFMSPTAAILAYHSYLHWIPAFLLCSVLLFFSWWFLFDGIYNLIRGFGWWFNKQEAAVNPFSELDKRIIPLPYWGEAIVKIVPLTVSSTIYALYFV